MNREIVFDSAAVIVNPAPRPVRRLGNKIL